FQARNRLPAAGRDRACPRCDNLATLQERLHARVVLELLERLERREARVLVVEADDETDIRAVVVEVVNEAATVRARIQRPTQRVLDQPGLDAACRQLPQLFQAEPVALGAGL